MTDRSNLITPIRLALAVMVVFSHSWVMTQGGSVQGEPLYRFTRSVAASNVAVDLFFVLSGYLITASWLRHQGLRYFTARVLRIYPAFIVASAVAILFAVIWGRGQISSDLAVNAGANALRLLSPSVPVRYAGPFPMVLDGPMWTIAYEFACYLGLAAILYSLRQRGWMVIGALGTAVLMLGLLRQMHGQQSPEGAFFPAFAAGSLFRLRGQEWLRRPRWALVVGALLAFFGLGVLGSPLLWELSGVVLAYPLLLLAAHSTRWPLRQDYSYGTYLFAFPVQQVLVTTLHLAAPIELLALTLLVTALLAVASWHCVERPSLSLLSRDWRGLGRSITYRAEAVTPG